MSRGKAGEISRDPDRKEPSVTPGNEKPLKGSKQGNDMIEFPFQKDDVGSSMGNGLEPGYVMMGGKLGA